MEIFSNFDNGSGEVIYTDKNRQYIAVSPQNINNAKALHIFIRLENIDIHKPVTLEFKNIHTKAGECNPVYSYNMEDWYRMDNEVSPYVQLFNKSTVYIARSIPYPYFRSLTLEDKIRNANFEVRDLCQSECGRSVKMFIFTNVKSKQDKKIIWIQARQHAFESHSSYVAEGLALWLTNPCAKKVLDNAEIYIVPIMDVDNVYLGGSGKDQEPVDFNRDWTCNPHFNAVKSAISILEPKCKENKLMAFVDIHSPWYPVVGFFSMSEEEDGGTNGKIARDFEKSVKQVKGANDWSHTIKSFKNGRGFTSKGFINSKCESRNTIALTLEIPHWKDSRGNFITKRGLLDYGKAFGVTLQHFLTDI